MNHLAHLIESLVHLGLRPFEALLRQVHCIRQKGASLLNLLGVAAVLHLDSPAFEELTQVFVNFVLFNLFHSFSNCCGQSLKTDRSRQLQNYGRIVSLMTHVGIRLPSFYKSGAPGRT